MEREFTNALCNTPLWTFALTVYSQHQVGLLSWQDDHGANVNRLIAFAFAWSQGRYVSYNSMNGQNLRRLEALTGRVRALRRGALQACRPQAKRLELELEGLHLQLLNSLMSEPMPIPSERPISKAIADYEQQLDTKKGTLVPFIERLATT